jgi:transcription initiation factor TFIID subunit 2
LALRPELLARFTNERKRKLQVDDGDRPSKRQSLEPSANGKSGLVKVEKYGGVDGKRKRLVVKMKIGRGKLPVE